MKKDITDRGDIENTVRSFYQKVIEDESIGYIFTDVAKVNWEKHLPVMFDFWENVLFYTGKYSGDVMNVHRHLNSMTELKTEHFKRWEKLFNQTVDELYSGENAERAKQKAFSISMIIQTKLNDYKK